jgi:hypothetical protein
MKFLAIPRIFTKRSWMKAWTLGRNEQFVTNPSKDEVQVMPVAKTKFIKNFDFDHQSKELVRSRQ